MLTEGGDRDKLGRGTIWKGQVPDCIHQNHIFRVRFDQSKFDSEYVSFILRSSDNKKHFQKIGKQSVNLASINKTQLSSLNIVCPEIKIQIQIKEKIKSILDNLSKMDETCSELISKISMLRKKILLIGFQGKLVPQDPNDESASELLKIKN